MQREAADAFDVSREPQAHSATCYGPGTQARQLLIARRLVERGVRFVQLWHGAGPAVGQPRRHRSRTTASWPASATRPIAALLTDLKQRGLLDETLVIWGGEFGRTPTVELPQAGRQRRARSTAATTTTTASPCWLAGGGVKGGQSYGATDEFGFKAVENRVHVHDLHATHPAPAGLRPRAAHLPLRRPRLPPDRRAWQGGSGADRLTRVFQTLGPSARMDVEERLMADQAAAISGWERAFMAAEKVRERLMRSTAALERAGVPYAVVGGNAVAEWVGRIDEDAVRNTRDVDILIRREDLVPRKRRSNQLVSSIATALAWICSSMGRKGVQHRRCISYSQANEFAKAIQPRRPK